MSGNTFGKLFTVTTFGESHGPALGAIVDGCPPGLELSEEDLQHDLDRRRPGTSRYTTQRREPDRVRILSGVFEGRTTGTPIGLLIENTDQRSRDYEKIKASFRPGHADYTYQQKYGIRDYRGGGRSSARETAMRVAAGAIAKKYLAVRYGVRIRGYVSQIGPYQLELKDWDAVEQNPFFCGDPERVPELEAFIHSLRREGDSIGAKVTVVAEGLPPGWGEPVFDRLDADIAHAMMSINAVKGVELSRGWRSGLGSPRPPSAARSIATRSLRRAFCPTTPAASSAVSPPVKISWSASPSSRPPASRRPGAPSTSTAIPSKSSPPAVTTPVSASAPPPSPKPCWRWC